MRRIQSSMLLTASAVAIVATAQAQDTVEDDGDVIVVSGIRRSLEEARDVKRDSSEFTDAIVADDIGKLPDTNVAESLGRVSGVQIQRGIGEGSDVSIRGQRQNVILYNGRQIQDSTGRGGNGLDQLGTSTYGLLAQVPSELIGKLEVSKVSGADQIAGALGGTVDISTRKPFDSSGRQIALTAGVSYEDLPEETGHELFGLYSDVFGANNEFGFLISGTLNTRKLAEQGLGTFSGYGLLSDNEPLSDGGGNPISPDSNGDGVPALYHLDPRSQQIAEDRDRVGLSAIAQWAPNDAIEVTADIFYSKVESDRDRHWIGYFAGFGAYTNPVFSANDVVVAGTVTRPIQTNVEFAAVESEVVSSALSATWELSDNFELFTEIAYTESEAFYDQFFFRLQSDTATPISFDLREGDFGSYSFANNLTDPVGLNLAIMFDNFFEAQTDDLALRADADWSFDHDFFESFEFGVRYQDLETVNSQSNVDIRPGIPAEDLGNLISIFDNPDFMSGELDGIPRSYLSAAPGVRSCADLSQFFTTAQNELCSDPSSALGSLLNGYTIEEQFFDAYAKLNFENVAAAIPFSGNVGVRVINRELTSTGNLLQNGGVVPNIFERDDTEVLPSAILKFDLNDNTVFRIGAARVIAFPETAALNNGLQLFGDNTGRGGSPDLDPFLANQLDFSLEYYFDNGGVLSGGVFFKDIETFIVGSTQQRDIPGEAMPFSIAQQVNGDESEVSGFELLYEQPFTFLPAPFDGLGVVATYSYIDSETPLTDNTGANITFPGLSENNVNVVGYYENGPFSGRVAVNWRDEFVDRLGPGDTPVFEDSYTDVSATASWDFNDNMSVLFEGINLLDEQQRTFNGFDEALRTNVQFGRIYKLSLRATF